uniref:Secreted protein n=1 Tax=Steinernema glaseri TaxID=37863 RepID=A0A1I8A729_9BILA
MSTSAAVVRKWSSRFSASPVASFRWSLFLLATVVTDVVSSLAVGFRREQNMFCAILLWSLLCKSSSTPAFVSWPILFLRSSLASALANMRLHLIVVPLYLICTVHLVGGNASTKRILDNLLSGYDKRIRPHSENNTAVIIRMSIVLAILIELNDENKGEFSFG